MTQGVTGYIGCFALLALLIMQGLGSLWKAMLAGAVAVPLLFLLVFNISPSFNQRVMQNVEEAGNFQDTAQQAEHQSIGPRLVFWGNTVEVIRSAPWLGVGTGDFPAAYEEVRKERTPEHHGNLDNPHNQYLLVAAQHGVLGLAACVAILLAQLVSGLRTRTWYRPLMFALPLFFLLIMMGDSYLLGAHSSIIFLVFSAMLFSGGRASGGGAGC